MAAHFTFASAQTRSRASWLRWVAVGVFVLSSSLNYLDRQLLSALAPTLKQEFNLSNAQFGEVLSGFFIIYSLVSPLAGWMVDRLGLNLGITLSMAVWSLAGMATGFTRSFAGMVGARGVLAIGEAAGIPCTGKVNGLYLESRELAFGTALNQVGITLGSVAAPLMVAVLAPLYGWRSVFVICGALGFVWLPLWLLTSKKIPATPTEESPKTQGNVSNILTDKRLWGLAAANALVMTPYALWFNWTTIFFVDRHHLTQTHANQLFVWVPPVFAAIGGFTGGWMAWRAIRAGRSIFAARLRICLVAAVVLLLTAVVPLANSPLLAVALISLSFFWCLVISTNVYAMPIEFFGVEHAAFSVSILTGSYGLMQTALSPAIGAMVDHLGFAPVCAAIAVMPLAGIGILKLSAK